MKKIIVVLILSAVLAGCSIGDNNEQEIFTGTIEGKETDISSEISGKITDIFIIEGELIQKGDKIAAIDTTDLELKLKKAKLVLELSNAKLQDVIDGARNEEVKNLKANLNKTEALIEGARKNYDYRLGNYNKIKKLYENSAVSEQQLIDAKALVDAEETNINSLEKQYDSVKAQLNLLLEGATDQKIKMLQSEVDMAKTEIEIISNQIEKAQIISPKNGVIQNINYEAGELIPNGGNIATLVDTENLWVKIYIPEKLLYKISLNEKINLFVDFLKDNKIVGEVTYISPEAEFTPQNVESKESKQEMVFEAKIKIVEGVSQLKPGMLVDVKLEGEK